MARSRGGERFGAELLYRNRHDGTFEDIGLSSGFAVADDGHEQSSMAIAVGDYNREGRVNFYVTSFQMTITRCTRMMVTEVFRR